jgi:hypothetical protein
VGVVTFVLVVVVVVVGVVEESVILVGALGVESVVPKLFVFEGVVFTLLFFLFVDVPELRTFLAIFFASSI